MAVTCSIKIYSSVFAWSCCLHINTRPLLSGGWWYGHSAPYRLPESHSGERQDFHRNQCQARQTRQCHVDSFPPNCNLHAYGHVSIGPTFTIFSESFRFLLDPFRRLAEKAVYQQPALKSNRLHVYLMFATLNLQAQQVYSPTSLHVAW